MKYFSLSTDSANKSQLTEVSSCFTPVCLCRLPLLFPSLVCILSLIGRNVFSATSRTCFSFRQMPSPFGVGPAHEKKIGHRRVDASGETTYKKAGLSSSYVSPFVFAFSFVAFLDSLGITIFADDFPPTPHGAVLFSVLRLQTTSSALQGAIQLGIGYTVGNLSSKPERDVLMQDFYVVESIFFPRCVGMSG